MNEHIQADVFLRRYFIGNQCKVKAENNDTFIITLTKELDKIIMQRPFYWHYIEQTNQVGNVTTLKLSTNIHNSSKDYEWIHFGTPKMNQICSHLEKQAKYIVLFEQVLTKQNVMLHPWLLLNIKVIYQGKTVNEELLSCGLNLINGTFRLQMMEHMENYVLSPTISPLNYTVSPIISLQSGYKRIEKEIDEYILHQDHQWIAESEKYLRKELTILKQFYSSNEKDQSMEKEREEIIARLSPQIKYEFINGGLIFLKAGDKS